MKNTGVMTDVIGKVAGIISAASIAGMMVLTAADIISRSQFRRSILGAYEVEEMLLMYATFLALVYSYAQGNVIRVELFTERLPKRTREVIDVINTAVVILIFSFLCYSSAIQTWNEFAVGQYRVGGIRLPTWLFMFPMVIGSALLLPVLVKQGTDMIANLARDREDSR